MFNFMSSFDANQGLVDVDIWRQTGAGTYNQWGDIDETAESAPIPTLAGRTKVQTIEKCVYEPRTTGVDAKSTTTDGTSYTKVTLYLSDPTVEIQPGDFFAFDNHNGQYEAWKLEGEGMTNNYVSPFSGVIGGREVFLIRIRELRHG